MSLVLLTNVMQYTGPGALEALLRDGHTVACHDAPFTDTAAHAAFDSQHAAALALQGQTPEAVHAEVVARWGVPDGAVSNDVYPITGKEIEVIPLDDLRATFEVVVVFPVRLTQLVLPAMKARGSGAFVFVTSTHETRPEPGFAVPTTLRAATTAFAKALAEEAAPFGIQANVVGPNYLYSEMYYPRAQFVDDPAGRKEIARALPLGRLERLEKVGELIAFLTSGKSPFTTGQAVYFTGGRP